MKKKTFCLIAACIFMVPAIFFISHKNKLASSNLPSLHVDTKIDFSSYRDFFNYIISTSETKNIDGVLRDGKAIIHDYGGNLATENLFEKLIGYKHDLLVMKPGGYGYKVDLKGLQYMDSALLKLQEQYFTAAQQAILFAEENRVRYLALEKLRLQTEAGDEDSYQEKWQEVLHQQPEYIQKSEKNSTLVHRLEEAGDLAGEARFYARVELVGAEGAQRLAHLDKKQSVFNQKVQSYLAERKKVLAENDLTDAEQRKKIRVRREQLFTQNQLKRLMALERIYDDEMN